MIAQKVQMMHREVKQLAQGHTAGKRRRQRLNLGTWACETKHSTTLHPGESWGKELCQLWEISGEGPWGSGLSPIWFDRTWIRKEINKSWLYLRMTGNQEGKKKGKDS
jgi:hypothetical protein